MQYFSTSRKAPRVGFEEATLKGQPPDKGLYFPETIPQVSKKMMDDIAAYSHAAIAHEVIKPFVGDAIDDASLKKIVEETVNFPIPLVDITKNIFSLELFHGPTLAFKDMGARFMSRCLGYFSKDIKKKIVVLVATSGDTGGAVAHGFHQVPGVDVVILYPSGKVSSVQEKQLTTLGENIHALEVNGNFDDCQQMVKTVFTSPEEYPGILLTSANSINIARWLPQQFYYFFAYQQFILRCPGMEPVCSVPSGNFGNICAGMLAQVAGLPVKHFIAACNANDTVPDYLKTFIYRPKQAVATISNAMDVGNPSNFARMLELFRNDENTLAKNLSAYSITDEETTITIKQVYDQHAYLLDPHGAVGYAAFQQYLQSNPGEKGIVLETAHPVKFYDVVEPVIHASIPLPASIQDQVNLPKNSTKIEAESLALHAFLQRF